MSQADANHIHHLAKRSLGGVKRAVVALYALSIVFAGLGVLLGAAAIEQVVRLRIVYAGAIVLFGGIGAVALKTALRNRWLAHPAGPVSGENNPIAAPAAQAEGANGAPQAP